MGKRGIGARKTPPGGPSWEFKGAQLREVLHKLQEPFLAGTSTPTSSQSKSAVRKEHSWSSSTFSLFSNFTTQHFGERVIKGPPSHHHHFPTQLDASSSYYLLPQEEPLGGKTLPPHQAFSRLLLLLFLKYRSLLLWLGKYKFTF